MIRRRNLTFSSRDPGGLLNFVTDKAALHDDCILVKVETMASKFRSSNGYISIKKPDIGMPFWAVLLTLEH